MTAPSPLLSDGIVNLAHYQVSDLLYKSLRGCPSSVSATYCKCIGPQRVRNSSSVCYKLFSLSLRCALLFPFFLVGQINGQLVWFIWRSVFGGVDVLREQEQVSSPPCVILDSNSL